jgi:hypothetical protein
MKQKNKDLCEALRRSEPEVPQLSADFAKQLAEQLKERDKGRDSLPNNPYKWLRLVAAIFVGIILVSGIAIAAIHFSKSSGFQDSRSSGNTLVEQSPSPVEGGRGEAFSNIRLDSLLGIVATHYGCTVVYRDEQPCSLRISTTWNQSQPLSSFIGLLNELDGLRLTTEGDTIFVSNK